MRACAVNIEKVIDRVRKLRKLATSTNANEAASAAAQADRLVQEHRLAEAQIEADTGNATESAAVDGVPLFTTKRMRPWRSSLAVVICRQYDVACWVSRRPVGAAFAMCGRASDVAIVRETYAWLEGEISRIAIARNERSDSFRMGCVSGIRTAYAIERHAAQRPGPTTGAIVLADRTAQAEAARDAFLHAPLKPQRESAARIDMGALERGRAVGATLARKQTKGEPWA